MTSKIKHRYLYHIYFIVTNSLSGDKMQSQTLGFRLVHNTASQGVDPSLK